MISGHINETVLSASYRRLSATADRSDSDADTLISYIDNIRQYTYVVIRQLQCCYCHYTPVSEHKQ